MYTFRAVLKDANFGNLFVGSHKADSIDHLFISIQTFNSQDFTTKTDADFYDYIVINDDADRAAAELAAIMTAEHCKAAGRAELLKNPD